MGRHVSCVCLVPANSRSGADIIVNSLNVKMIDKAGALRLAGGIGERHVVAGDVGEVRDDDLLKRRQPPQPAAVPQSQSQLRRRRHRQVAARAMPGSVVCGEHR